ncbi:MAG: hypothetical protein LUI10_05335 [Lachnospiraceae bacterium]|nr:hypothetical protein [Lachnospiraceae bacterium]
MFTLFDQDEALRDYIISEKRETAREMEERVAREMAQAMYQDRYPIKVIAKYVRSNPETVRQWLGLNPQT